MLPDSWRDHYELMRDLAMAAVEVEHLSADADAARKLSEEILDNVRDLDDKVIVRDLQMSFHIGRQDMREALDIGLDTLSLLGVALPREPEALAAREQALREQLGLDALRLEALEALPDLTDPHQAVILRILERTGSPAFYLEPLLKSVLLLTQLDLCMRDGHSAPAAAVYMQYAAVLCGDDPDVELASRLGALAMRLVERFPDPAIAVTVEHMFYGFVHPWNRPMREAVEPLRALIQRGLQVGEMQFASYSAVWSPWYRFHAGDPLDAGYREQCAHLALVERYGMTLARELLCAGVRVIRALLGQSSEREGRREGTGDVKEQ